jgi:hypothetical protein
MVCKIAFKTYDNINAKQYFCSHKCQGIQWKHDPIYKICAHCKKEFEATVIYKKKKYCSKLCYTKAQTGSTRHSIWRDGSNKEKLDRLHKHFLKYVIKNENGCWGWTGGPSKKYGALQYGENKKSISAHRASWIIHKGEIPAGMFVCHTCDNPPCTKPEHLFLGTPKDNVQDMISKKRRNIVCGEKAPWSKLTEKDVRAIKSLLGRLHYTKIAERFNVSLSTIYDIKDSRTWSHLL